MLAHAPVASEPEREAWAQWATWLPEALAGVAAEGTVRAAPELPHAAPVWREAAERIRRHVEIVSGALVGAQDGSDHCEPARMWEPHQR